MLKKLRRAFVRIRPVAQTIAAIASTTAAIIKILKYFGIQGLGTNRGLLPGSSLFALLPMMLKCCPKTFIAANFELSAKSIVPVRV